MWHAHPYYWRARYDDDNDRIIFEYIDETDLGGDNWVENENARIDASGFDAGALAADFTVRGVENNIPTTIHYSDGIDTWIAESDEASATGWAWENTTKVFDGTAPDTYKRVNLCADRATPNHKLYATAVFSDDSESTKYVVCKIQSTALDITGWGGAITISDDTNTDFIYGQSCRSVGASGAEKDDILFVYKEGDVIKSQYTSAGVVRGIQTVDAAAYSGVTGFDLEHSTVYDEKICHVLFIDADGTIKNIHREDGYTTAWSGTDTLSSHTQGHGGVCISEHGDGIMYFLWKHNTLIEYRIHRHNPEVWVPALANPESEFDPSTDAVAQTDSVFQLHSIDGVDAYEALPVAWVGKVGEDLCEIGWGLLAGASDAIYTRCDENPLPTNDDDLCVFFIPSEYVDVATDDEIYVDQEGNYHLVFQFRDKNINGNNTDKIKVSWNGQSDLAPSTSTVYLQIYNQDTDTWETLNSDDVTAADTDFTLSGEQFATVDKYYELMDGDYWVSCRVYQEAVY